MLYQYFSRIYERNEKIANTRNEYNTWGNSMKFKSDATFITKESGMRTS